LPALRVIKKEIMNKGHEAAFPSQMENTPMGLTKREWLVGMLVSGPLMGHGAIPPITEIWKLADKILEGEDTRVASPPDSL
jgi:hypothetical protein